MTRAASAAAAGAVLLASVVSAAAFDLQGHRGARGLAPENTLPAFAKALGIGVTTLELDVGMTRDGILVVSHDPRLNPNLTRLEGAFLETSGPALRELTLAEVKRYDVGRLKPGSQYAKAFPDQMPVDGTAIPTWRRSSSSPGRPPSDSTSKRRSPRPRVPKPPIPRPSSAPSSRRRERRAFSTGSPSSPSTGERSRRRARSRPKCRACASQPSCGRSIMSRRITQAAHRGRQA
jgi:hypothetical protein